jgi:hypothetical protein
MRDRSLCGLGLVLLVALGFGACAGGRAPQSDDDISAGGTGNSGTGGHSAGTGGIGGTTSTGVGGQGGDACIVGLTPCNQQCVDLLTNPLHCGQCNNPCAPDRYCGVGNCICSGGLLDCGGTCTDTQTSTAHCGSCDAPCAVDQTCSGGGCLCAGGLKDCGGTCVDQHTDPDHCGWLCRQCAADEQCQFGFCTCSSPVCGVCPDYIINLPSTVPQTVQGSTSNAADSQSAPCGSSSGGYDVTHQFTAPTAGPYTFSLCGGASFDTVLYVLSMSCSSLGCDDDACSPQSRVTVTLAQGQQVLVVVDGYSSSAYGAFTMTIASP